MRMIELTDGSQVTAAQFKAQNPRVQYGGAFPSSAYLETIGASIVTVTVPTPDKYPDIRSARLAMKVFIDDFTTKITDEYPDDEIASFGRKAEAARMVDAGTARADQTAMIQNEADITGETLEAHATAIIANASVFETIISRASGLRQATDALLVQATTSDEREAVLEAAAVQAREMAEVFGI
jgi:hypothetical protein